MFDLIFQFIFILVAVIVQVFIPGFPKEILLLQSGAVFGVVIGSILNWIAMILAAQVGYEVVRRSVETGGRYSTFLDQYRQSSLVRKLEQNGNKGLFALRLIPTGPNDVLSLMSGGLFLPRRGFILVSFTTSLPYAILLAYLGSIGSSLISTTVLLQINIVFFVFSLLIYVGQRIIKSRQSLKDKGEEGI